MDLVKKGSIASSFTFECRNKAKIQNRIKMLKEAEYYLSKYTSYCVQGHDNNFSTVQALLATIEHFCTEGNYRKQTTKEERQRGRLVYIGVYKPLEPVCKDTLSVSNCMESLIVQCPELLLIIKAFKSAQIKKSSILKQHFITCHL